MNITPAMKRALEKLDEHGHLYVGSMIERSTADALKRRGLASVDRFGGLRERFVRDRVELTDEGRQVLK